MATSKSNYYYFYFRNWCMEFISNGHLIEYSLPGIAVNFFLKKGSFGKLITTTTHKAGSKEEKLHLFWCSYRNNFFYTSKDSEVETILSQLTFMCDIVRWKANPRKQGHLWEGWGEWDSTHSPWDGPDVVQLLLFSQGYRPFPVKRWKMKTD